MNLFPVNPPLRRSDRCRILPFLGNAKKVRAWLRDGKPSPEDLKRAVMLETARTEGCGMRHDVVTDILVALQRHERSRILARIEGERKILKKSKP